MRGGDPDQPVAAVRPGHGRVDLETAAAEHAVGLAREALGGWEPCRDAEELWARLAAAHERLRTLLAARPGLRTVLASAPATAAPQDDPWLDAVVDDAVALGLVGEPHLPLCRAATAAVVGAADRLALSGRPVGADDLPRVLLNLWRG